MRDDWNLVTVEGFPPYSLGLGRGGLLPFKVRPAPLSGPRGVGVAAALLGTWQIDQAQNRLLERNYSKHPKGTYSHGMPILSPLPSQDRVLIRNRL